MSHSTGFLMRKVWVALASVFVITAVYGWAVDFVTASGERTVYTVECAHGDWTGNRCLGEMAAGIRYRFRALPARGEVLFWTIGRAEPSGKLTGCAVTDGRNWSCPPSPDAARSITLSMVHGRPSPDPQRRTRPLHSVSKLYWLAMRQGVPVGATADE